MKTLKQRKQKKASTSQRKAATLKLKRKQQPHDSYKHLKWIKFGFVDIIQSETDQKYYVRKGLAIDDFDDDDDKK